MDFESVKAWLARQTGREIRIRWLLACLGILLTPFALIVGIFLLFAFARMISKDWNDPNIDVKCIWVALGIMVLLFVVNRFMPREKENYYDHDEPDGSLIGDYTHRKKVQARFLLWILFTGPRLVDWVIFSFRRIYRLKKQDTHSCAALLWLLLLKGRRTPYPDIIRELDWLDLEGTLPQVAWIPGVLCFQTQPPAVTLTDDLRTAIRQGSPPP